MDSGAGGGLGQSVVAAANRLILLQEVTSALAQANDLAEIADTVMATTKGAVGADASVLCVIRDRAFQVLATVGVAERIIEQWQEFPLDAPLPASDAVRHNRPVLLHSPEDRDAKYPDLAGMPMEHQSWVILPMLLEGHAVGVLACGWIAPDGFDEASAGWLQAVADQCGAAIKRGMLLESERSARATLEVLADASQILSSSLDPDVTLRRLTRVVLPALGDACLVHLLDRHGLALAEVAHLDPDQERLLRELSARLGGYADDGHLAEVARTGEPMLLPEVPPEMLAQAARDEEHARLLAALRLHSALSVPLIAAERMLGTLSLLLSTRTRRYSSTDIRLAQDLAARAAVALANSQAHARLTEIAHTLQQSLRPPSLPAIDGLRLASRYEPLGEGVEVGGDFYDVFPLGQGRWGVTIGDVVGKGVASAALTSLARNTVRAAARRHRSPGAVLTELNDVILTSDMSQPFLTIVYLAVTVDADGGARASLALGGHPHPYLLAAGHPPQPVGQSGQLIGMLAQPRVHDETVLIRPGQSLVLYTDGLTEARSEGGDMSESVFLDTLAALSADSPEHIAERVIDMILGFQPHPRDDMAVLVLAPEPAGERLDQPEHAADSGEYGGHAERHREPGGGAPGGHHTADQKPGQAQQQDGDQRAHSTPLVEGTPQTWGSASAATRKARASALYCASVT